MNILKMASIGIFLIGIVVIGVGFAGLAMVELEREQYSIYSDLGDTADFRTVQVLDPGHTYLITVGLEDAYSHTGAGYEAIVDGTVMIYLDGTLIRDVDLYDREWRDEDSNGVDAFDSLSYEFTPLSSTNITIVGSMEIGDTWTITIYQDLPADIDTRAGTQIAIMLLGFVLFFIGVAIFIKIRRS